MTTAAEINPVRLRPAPDQVVLVGITEHPVLREYRERRNPQNLPLDPTWFMHSFDRAPHDIWVEARNKPSIRHLEVRQPGIDDRVITEEVASGSLVLERHRPGCEVPAKARSVFWIVAPHHVSFQHNETIDEIRPC